MLKKAKIAFLLIMTLVFALQGVGMETALAAVSTEKWNLNELTYNNVLNYVGEISPYGAIAHTYMQKDHSEANVFADDIIRYGSNTPFLASNDTQQVMKDFTVEATVTLPEIHMADELTFGIFTKNGENFEYTGMQTTVEVKNETSVDLNFGRITDPSLMKTELYVRQIKDNSTADQVNIVDNSGINDDGMRVTYGPAVITGNFSSFYLGSLDMHNVGENGAYEIFQNDVTYYHQMQLGSDIRLYRADGTLLPDSSGEPASEVYIYDVDWGTGAARKLKHVSYDGTNFIIYGTRVIDVVYHDSKDLAGSVYDESDDGVLDRMAELSYALSNVQVLNSETGKYETELGGSSIGRAGDAPLATGNSTVTGPADNGSIVSMYHLTTVTEGEVTHINLADLNENETQLKEWVNKGLPIADNEYVVMNVVCPKEGTFSLDATDIALRTSDGREVASEDAWRAGQTASFARVIWNPVYYDEASGTYQPFKGTVVVGDHHGGLVLAPAADIVTASSAQAVTLVGNTITNTKEIHQTSVGTNRTHVRMVNSPVTRVFGTKVWTNPSKAEDSITVTLNAKTYDMTVAEPIEIRNFTKGDDGVWDWSFENLPKYTYDENGTEHLIVYSITEKGVYQHNVSVTGSVEAGFTITNTYDTSKTTVNGQKVWDDNDDQDGIRPDSIVLTLQRKTQFSNNWTDVKDKTVTKATDWQFSFGDLPLENEFGWSYSYRIVEKKENIPSGYTPQGEEVRGGSYVFTQGSNGTTTVTNKHEPETITVKGSKTWRDDHNKYQSRPTNIVVKLYADGKEVDSITVSAPQTGPGEKWQWAFADKYPKYKDGVEIEYTVKEFHNNQEGVYGYAYSVTETERNKEQNFAMTNIVKKTTVKGNKTWTGYENVPTDFQYSVLPEKIIVNLYKKEGNREVLVDSKEVTEHSNVDGKTWGWQFTELPTFNVDGTAVEYIVREEPVAGWESNGAQDKNASGADNNSNWVTYNISNTFKPISLTAKKIWSDGNDNHANESVALSLWYSENNGESWRQLGNSVNYNWQAIMVVLNEQNNWEATIDNLPEYQKNGSKLLYKFQEEQVPNGYDVSYGNEGNVYTVTNTSTTTVTTTSITVTKVWDGGTAQDISSALNLWQVVNGTATNVTETYQNKLEYKATDNSYTWTELPSSVGENQATYYVTETQVPGYAAPEYTNTGDNASVTDKAYNNGTIKNTYETASIKVTKEWVGGDASNRPAITLKLWKQVEGETTATDVTTTYQANYANTDAEYKWSNLPKYEVVNGEAKEITYYVTETQVPGYAAPEYSNTGDNASVADKAYNNGTIKNTYETASITVTKEWVGGDANNRPAITLKLWKQVEGETTATDVTTTYQANYANTGAEYKWSNLPKYEVVNGEAKEIIYYVTETQVPGYAAPEYINTGDNVSVADKAYDNGMIKNTYETASITVTKQWVGGDANNRPAITLKLWKQVEGETTATDETATYQANYANTGAEHKWSNLPKYEVVNGEAKKITYYVTETQVPGYAAPEYINTGDNASVKDKAYNNGTIKNTATVASVSVEIKAHKTVDGSDNIPSKYYSFALYKVADDGTRTLLETVTNERGSVIFSEITYTEPNTYYYIMKEVADGEANMLYDSTEHSVTVEVERENDGSLTANVTYDNGSDWEPTFKNWTTLEVEIPVAKRIVAPEGETVNEEFIFRMEPYASSPARAMPTDAITDSSGLHAIATVEGENTTNFTKVVFTAESIQSSTGQEFAWVVKEVKGDNEDEIEYDTTAYCYLITIGMNENNEPYLMDRELYDKDHKVIGTTQIEIQKGTSSEYGKFIAGTDEAGNKTYSNAIVFTNTMKTTSITVYKHWSDGNVQNISGALQLWKIVDGEETNVTEKYRNNLKYNATNKSYTWSNLRLKDNGQPITYVVRETAPTGYEVKYPENEQGVDQGYAANGQTITNKLLTTSITVEKEWSDNTDHSKDTVTVRLYKKVGNDEETYEVVQLPYKGEWTYTWSNLPEYGVDASGKTEKITYRVDEEEGPDGYVANVGAMDANGMVKITNTKITDTSASITLLKTVNQLGNKTPADTTFYFEIVGGLQNNTGNQTGSNANVGASSVLLPVEVASGRGEETYTFNFAQDGTYIYEIHELKPDAKNELPQQPGFTYTGKKYKVEYLVELDDAALLTVNDETWYVTNENDEYVNMTAKPDSLEFINDYTLTDISVEKKWSDDGADHSKDSVQVQLYKTVGTAEKVAEGTPETLNADKEWKHTWSNLSLRDDDGNAIVYTVDEVGTPAGYVKNAEKDLEKDALGFHFKITNTKITDTAGELIINKTVKKTGDVEPNTTDAFTFSIEQVEKPVGGEQTFDKVVRTNGESAAPVALLFPVKGTYVYKVTEVIPEKEEDRLPGYTYDNTVYTVTFNVKQDDKTAKLTADAPVWTKNGTVDANVDSADFVNEYGMTSISGTKVWNDANNQDGVRPDSITIKLLAGGQPAGKSVTLTAANADASNENVWNWTFTDLLKYTVDVTGNATPIVYTVEEVTTGANGEALSWVQHYTGKVEENATKTGFVITNTHAPGAVNITVTKVWEDNNATNRPAITLTLYKGENVVVTDAQGEKLAPTVNDNKYTWSNLPEKENGEIIVYYVKEDAAAQGYKEPVYTNTEANATVTDKALNGGTITNTLAEGEASFDITKTLVNGAYLAEGQTKSFTFALYEYDNDKEGAEVATTTITLPAADDSTENVLGQIKFDLKFGTHTYLLKEVKGTDADIDYDTTQYKLELTAGVNKIENPGTLGLNDFKFTTMEDEEVTSLAFSNTYKYEADGVLHLEATKAMSSDSDVQTMKADQFTFGIFKGEVQVSTGTNAENGAIVFDEISYDQSDIGATYLYTVKELPGIAEDETYNYFYDDTVYNLSVSVTDGGNGNLIVTKTITKGAEAVDAIEFTNTIKNKVGHIGVMKVDKADDKKGLADAVFGVYTQVDADDKIVKTSWVGDIRTGDTGAGSLQNLPIGTYYVQESMAPKGYQLDETVYTVVVKEGETAMVNGEKVFNAKLGRLMLRKADRLNPDKALPGAVYTLYSDEACLPEDKVADITTGDDGIGYLDDVAPGTYWVKETKAPVGYEVDPLPYKVVIEENPDPEKPAFVQVTDFPLRGALVISKTVVGVEETTETFLFDIELSIATADPIVGSYEATLNGVATEKVTFTASDKGAKATVSLKSGDTLAISGVRDGVTYTVTEQPNSRYDVTVNNVKANVATGTIKEGAVTVAAFQNTLKQTGFTVEKVWQGAEGGEIELTLFANGVKVEPQPEYTKEGNKYSYADLTMVDEKGQEILYTVKETAMAGYATSYKNIAPYADKTDCAYNGGQIINQALTSFSVKKEWDGLAERETAPAIQLTLYCNGTIVTKATPKPDAKGWYVYTDLPATVDGKAAVYTVKEEPLSGYTTTYINKGENAAVTDCAYNGSTIVNSKIPQTGDGTPLALWMTTMLLAALGLVGLKVNSRKREN